MIDIPAKSQHRLSSDFAADKVQTHIITDSYIPLLDVLQRAPPTGGYRIATPQRWPDLLSLVYLWTPLLSAAFIWLLDLGDIVVQQVL